MTFPSIFVRLNTGRSYVIGPPGTSSSYTFTAEGGYSVETDGSWVSVFKDGWGQKLPASDVVNLVFKDQDAPADAREASGREAGGVNDGGRGIPLGTDASENTSKDPRELPKAPKAPTDDEAREGRDRAKAQEDKRQAEGELKKAEKKLQEATQTEKAADAHPESDVHDTVARATQGGKHKGGK